MKLVFIRHGDPNYEIDSLTKKGWREAELLAKRIEKLDVQAFYCSPLGRAKDTCNTTLKRIGRECEILPWLEEFHVPVKDPHNGNDRIPWDLMPTYWTTQESLYHKTDWINADIMKTGEVSRRYNEVVNGLDELLKKYGYERENAYYRVTKANTDTLVFYCHLGVQFVILSYLLGISAPVLWQGFFVAPTSVTILETEEREKGIAYFRCRCLGDTSHLYVADEPSSRSGFYNEVFQQEV